MSEVTVSEPFVVRVPPRKKQKLPDLIKAGRYDRVNELVTSRNFPFRTLSLGERSIVIVHPGEDMDTGDVLGLAHRLSMMRDHNLTRPQYEDAFLFGAQFPDEMEQGPIVFLHEPWYFSGHNFVLTLHRKEDQRRLRLPGIVSRWYQDYRFAFVIVPKEQ